MADKVKYLDLAGLTTYDGKIKGVIDSKVAAGIAAIPTSEITSVTQKAGENSDQFEIAYKNNKGESKTTDFTIGAPTLSTVENATAYGLMSSGDKDAIAKNKTDISALSTKVDNLVTAGGEPNKIDTISLNNKTVSFTVDAAKNADLTLDVDYDTTTKKVRLKSGETVLSDFDASALVKDSNLDSVTLVSVTTADATDERPAGKYFKFTWNKDAGKEDVYISAENAYPYIDAAGLAGAGYNSEKRGSWRIFLGIAATALPTGDIKREFGLSYEPALTGGKDWFETVETELDAIPTTYAKATDVTTNLEAKADKTELPTVSTSGTISIQDSLNYGSTDKSFLIELSVSKTGVNNEIELSQIGFTDWADAIDTQVKTNTDAIANITAITTDDIDNLFK